MPNKSTEIQIYNFLWNSEVPQLYQMSTRSLLRKDISLSNLKKMHTKTKNCLHTHKHKSPFIHNHIQLLTFYVPCNIAFALGL